MLIGLQEHGSQGSKTTGRIVNIISYQADADLNQAIVTGVRQQERWIDFQTAKAAGLKGVKDSEVLAIAAQQERILVSHDLKTMPSEFAKFIRSNYSAGLIIVPQKLPVEIAIEELLRIWAIGSAEEWVDRIYGPYIFEILFEMRWNG